MIRNLAAECRMPLCYGGGVKTLEQAERIIGMGVEKVALSSAAVEDPELVERIAEVVGGQSVVVVLDVRRNKRGAAEVWTHNGTRSAGKLAVDLAKAMAGPRGRGNRRQFDRQRRRDEGLRPRSRRRRAAARSVFP